MGQKIKSLIRFIHDPEVSKWFIIRYAIGQILAYSGIGKYLTFSTPYYRLYLTKSPVAMVLFGDPTHVRDEEDVAVDLLRPGDVALDIGANIGTWSLRAAKLVAARGKVFSFEGHPHTASIIEQNITLNKLNNVVIVAAALGHKTGEVTFSKDEYDDVNHVLEDADGISVPLIRLDDFEPLKDIPQIRCINLDVEGYELFVLRGAEQILAKSDYVIFEAYEPNSRRYGCTLDELFRWFTDHEFILLDPLSKKPINPRTTGQLSVENVLATRLDLNTF